MTRALMRGSSFAPIWCDYCRANIRADSVRGCLRKTCETKALLLARDMKETDDATRN